MGLTETEMEELKGYLPEEFAASPRLGAWVKAAMFRVGRCYFGKAYVYALSLVVSHKAAMEARGSDGQAGQVTSKREGDLSVSYGNAGNGGGDLAATSYGQAFLSLLEQYSRRPGITGGVGFGKFCCGAMKVI